MLRVDIHNVTLCRPSQGMSKVWIEIGNSVRENNFVFPEFESLSLESGDHINESLVSYLLIHNRSLLHFFEPSAQVRLRGIDSPLQVRKGGGEGEESKGNLEGEHEGSLPNENVRQQSRRKRCRGR